MKVLLSLVVLLALASSQGAQLPTSRSNLYHGYYYPGDVLLYRTYLQKGAIPNGIQTQDLIYRGNFNTRISYISATEVGYTQYANAWVLAGGMGYNHTTIRFQTARGWGFYYMVEVWGR